MATNVGGTALSLSGAEPLAKEDESHICRWNHHHRRHRSLPPLRSLSRSGALCGAGLGSNGSARSTNLHSQPSRSMANTNSACEQRQAHRDYVSGFSTTCAKAGTIAITISAGPLTDLGVNPKIKCELSQPGLDASTRVSPAGERRHVAHRRSRENGSLPGYVTVARTATLSAYVYAESATLTYKTGQKP